ncbi:MerR family transcriptional regulator [Promicromonospora sp. NPDC019610]|uniref:MerR family transcriptional regulator n=1 Tax=Promicromonospora sp. NPDC019610 TaxID=3364405 RepID=UPI00379EC2A5
MQISELVRRADVPLATVKFYIREGMLPAGRSTGARRAEYDQEHLDRLRLIRSMTVAAGLPLHQVRQILRIIDHPDRGVYETLGRAVEVLAGATETTETRAPEAPVATGAAIHPRARAAVAQLGDAYARSSEHLAAFAQLDRALLAAEEAGLPADPARLRVYGEHVAAIARAEVAQMPAGDRQAAVQYAVLGTALYEPVLTALRRLAHQNLAADLPDAPPAARIDPPAP